MQRLMMKALRHGVVVPVAARFTIRAAKVYPKAEQRGRMVARGDRMTRLREKERPSGRVRTV